MKVGDPIILALQLPDGVADRHVRAYVETEVGAAVPGSPFAVPHMAHGRYVFYDPSNLTFPSGAVEVHSTFAVFDDAGYTQESDTYGRSLDVYRLDTVAQSIAQINTVVDSLQDAVELLSRLQVTAELTGTVEVEEALVGLIVDDP